MQSGSQTGRKDTARRTWVRHAAAALVALVLNGALMLYLASWSAGIAAEERGPVRAYPLRVTRVPPPEEPAMERAPRQAAQPRRSRPAEVSLSQPAPPAMPSMKTPVSMPELSLPDTSEVAPEGDLEVPLYQPEAGAPSRLSLVAALWSRDSDGAGTGPASSEPVLIRPPDLSAYYPYRARLKSITGQTEVRLQVSAQGDVTAVEVLSSTPPQVFDQAAQRVCRALRFQPARREGRPVVSAVRLTLVWRLE